MNKGLYANIHAKRKRMPGSKGAPTAKAFKQSAKTASSKKNRVTYE